MEQIEKAAEAAWETARVQSGWMGICSTWAEVEESSKEEWRALCRAVQPILAPAPASVPGDLVERMHFAWSADVVDEDLKLPYPRMTAVLRIAQADHEAELQAQRAVLAGPVTMKEWEESNLDNFVLQSFNKLLAARAAKLDKKPEPTLEEQIHSEIADAFLHQDFRPWTSPTALWQSSSAAERQCSHDTPRMTPQSDREYLESRFEWILVKPSETYMGLRRDQWYWRLPISQSPTGADSEAEALSAAKAFTVEREEEIRKLQGGIKMVEHQMLRASFDSMKIVSGECGSLSRDLEGAFAACSVGWYDVLTRLQSTLDELQRGMKGSQ